MTSFEAVEPTGILFGGLPNTGKTTYLALLYLAIIGDRAAELQLGRFSDDREHLNNISQRLQRCEPAIHTEVDERKSLSLSLLVGAGQVTTILQIPDASGEIWDAALVERHLPAEIDERARSANAFIIFVHAKADFDPGTTIVGANTADIAVHGREVPDSVVTDEPPGRSPTQVSLVELMQILGEDRCNRPVRACLVISAYDLVRQPTAPDDWVAGNLPLLAQYADVNRDWLAFAVFGASAQGGKFDGEGSSENLLNQDALDRSSLMWGDGTLGSIEDPILWALKIRG